MAQFLRVGAVIRKDRDACGGARLDLPALEDEWLADRLSNTLSHLFGFDRIPDALEHDRKLVAGDSRQRIIRPQNAFDSESDLAQERIASPPAPGVVDLLEAIEIDGNHCEPLILSRRRPQSTIQTLVEEHPVRKAGKLVAICLEIKIVIAPALLHRKTREPSSPLDHGKSAPVGPDISR